MRRRRGIALALGLALAAPATAWADEAIARRLAALASLSSPDAARRAAKLAAEPPRGSCAGPTWWRLTGYGLRARIDTAVRDASLRYAVPAGLVHAVIRHESAYDVDAVSHRGAQGLMQLMPGTARELGVTCPFEPRQNVLGGARYLRRLRDRLGSWPRALAGYHAGPARVERGRIPAETRSYVRRVLTSWEPGRLAWMDLP